jgi:hypothetical protein
MHGSSQTRVRVNRYRPQTRFASPRSEIFPDPAGRSGNSGSPASEVTHTEPTASAPDAVPQKGITAAATVREIARHMVIAQGFTLSVAGTIATLVVERTDTRPLAIWLFVTGAGVGYGLVGIASGAHRRTVPSATLTINGLRLLNLVPILVVPVATSIANQIPYTPVAFACAGFLVVAGYIGGLSLFLSLFGSASILVRRPSPKQAITNTAAQDAITNTGAQDRDWPTTLRLPVGGAGDDEQNINARQVRQEPGLASGTA